MSFRVSSISLATIMALSFAVPVAAQQCKNIAAQLNSTQTLYVARVGCEAASCFAALSENRPNKIAYRGMIFLYTTSQGSKQNSIVVIHTKQMNETVNRRSGGGNLQDEFAKKTISIDRGEIPFACAGDRIVSASPRSISGMNLQEYDNYHRRGELVTDDQTYLNDRIHLNYYNGNCNRATNDYVARRYFLTHDIENYEEMPSTLQTSRAGRAFTSFFGENAIASNYSEIVDSDELEVHALGYQRAEKSFSCIEFPLTLKGDSAELAISDLEDKRAEVLGDPASRRVWELKFSTGTEN